MEFTQNKTTKQSPFKKALIAYFQEHYGKLARHLHFNNQGIAMGQLAAEKKLTSGNDRFAEKNYIKAMQLYKISAYPYYLCEGFYKIGLCLLKIEHSLPEDWEKFPFYKKYFENSDPTTSQPRDRAAVFFREIIKLAPNLKCTELFTPETKPSEYYISALYELSVGISQGLAIAEIDLLDTPLENRPIEDLNATEVEIALLTRVITFDPSHDNAKKRLSLLQKFEPKDELPTCFAKRSNGQNYKLLCANNIFSVTDKKKAFRLAHELSREAFQQEYHDELLYSNLTVS